MSLFKGWNFYRNPPQASTELDKPPCLSALDSKHYDSNVLLLLECVKQTILRRSSKPATMHVIGQFLTKLVEFRIEHILTKEVIATVSHTCFGMHEVTSFLDEIAVRLVTQSGDRDLLTKLSHNLAFGLNPKFGNKSLAPSQYRADFDCIDTEFDEDSAISLLSDNRQYLVFTMLVMHYTSHTAK